MLVVRAPLTFLTYVFTFNFNMFSGGLELLMEMPRPSIAATGSSLCIYYLACHGDTMEKICGLPSLTLERLVK